MMSEYETSDEHRPVLWYRGYPIYAAHLIVVVFVASMFVATILNLFNIGGLLSAFVYYSGRVLHGEVWRVVTYGLVNPMNSTDFAWRFVIDMAMMVWFGREVERSFGRRTFLVFFGCLYLLTPLFYTLVGPWWPQALAGETGSFGVFIAFVALYPEAPFFFGLVAKWVGVIFVGIYTLIALNNREFVSLFSLWLTTGFAWAFVRFQQGQYRFALPALFRRKPAAQIVPDTGAPVSKETPTTSMSEIDALLDKIAQSGIGSLTARERAKLDAARADLLKRDSGRR